MKSNLFLSLILLALLSLFIFFIFAKTQDYDATNPQSPESSTPAVISTPTPTPIQYNSSTDLKQETSQINPRVEEIDFDSLNKINSSFE